MAGTDRKQLEQLNKEALIELVLSQRERLEQMDRNIQLILEQMSDLKRRRYGRSTEKLEIGQQISFREENGEIVFFNEAEAVVDEAEAEKEDASPRPPRKRKGKREEDLEGLPVIPVEHTMAEEELREVFGEEGYKRLPDEIYRRYRFVPAQVAVEEHHVAV